MICSSRSFFNCNPKFSRSSFNKKTSVELILIKRTSAELLLIKRTSAELWAKFLQFQPEFSRSFF